MAELEEQIAKLSPAKRALLARMRGKAASSSSITRRSSTGPAPLSFAQQRLWLIHQFDPESYLYNVPRYLRLTGKLNLSVLANALNEIVRRHEVLRTTFQTESGQPVQSLSSEVRISLPLIDLTDEPEAVRKADALQMALAEYRQPFDLARGPLIRATVWRINEDEHNLLLVMHHIVSDGWTGGILFEELGEHYQALAAGCPTALPDLQIQYADYAEWQRDLVEQSLEEEITYWQNKLAGAPPILELPTDRVRPEQTSFQGQTGSLQFSSEMAKQLTEFAQSRGMTLYPVLLAALKILIYRWTAQTDIVIGTISANRNSTEVEKLIGCFMNFLALRDNVEENSTAEAFLLSVRDSVLEAFKHQECPFEKIVEAINPGRALNVNPLYNVALLLQNYPEFAFRTDGIDARFLTFNTEVAFLDLRFLVTETPEGFRLECESNKDLFDPETGDLLLLGYRDVVRQLIEHPTLEIRNFQIPQALVRQAAMSAAREQTLAIASTFTAEPIEEPLDFWMKALGIPSRIKFAPFDQIYQQLLDPGSLLRRNQLGANLILLRLEDLQVFQGSDLSQFENSLKVRVSELINSVRAAVHRSRVPYLIFACPPSLSTLDVTETLEVYAKAETQLAAGLENVKGVKFVPWSELNARYPVPDYYDDYSWKIGHIPYTSAFFIAIATLFTRLLTATHANYQVIVINGDRILWDVPDRANSAQEIKVLESHVALQDFLIDQQDAGRLLCLHSDLTEEDFSSLFNTAPNMKLGWEHFVSTQFGRPIHQSLVDIADELGLGLAHFIYVDNDPLACTEVSSKIPEMFVAKLPLERALKYLNELWVFDNFDMEQVLPAESTTISQSRPTITPAILYDLATRFSTVTNIAEAIDQKRVRRTLAGIHEPPSSPTEELLGDMWAGLLKVKNPSVRDNFFALGGHSLLAAQLVARVRKSFGVELPLRAVFNAPTIAGFARLIEAARYGDQEGFTPQLLPTPRNVEIPLSFAQQRLWFIDQLEPGNPLYNIPQMYRMHGLLQLDALEQSVNEIVRRHESMRTFFTTIAGRPVQTIVQELSIPLEVVLFEGVNSEDLELRVQNFARERALEPFDLTKVPLFRVTLLVLGKRDHVLLLTLHHIIGDGWSGGLLATELMTHYEAFSQGLQSPLPDLAIQYADFAVWQRSWLRDGVLEQQVNYWRNQLNGAPGVLELPTDRPRPAAQRHRGAIRSRSLSLELLQELKKSSQAEGVTLFMTLLAIYQLLLFRYSGQEDIVVGSPVAGRNFTEIEPLIGFFVNTLALRTDLSGDPTFRDLLARVKQVALDAFAHQEIPFERLVEELRPERSLSYNPIFQVLFGLQTATAQNFELPDLHVERTAVHQDTSTFDLGWFAFERPDGLFLRLEYDTDLFDAETIDRMIGHFESLIRAAVANPSLPISALPLLDNDEREQVLVEFNQTAAKYPDVCIHDLVSAQASDQPNAIALIAGDVRITYGELDARANQLAHFLIERGAGPDIPIGILSERTPGLVIGILAILKAGSPYVPLDPDYPNERLAYVLEDAKPLLILTQASLKDDLPSYLGTTIYLDSDWDEISRQPKSNPVTDVKPTNLAYILFTSGSTGRPKGVALEHRTPVTFIQWALTVFTPQELSGVLFSTSVCFDVSMFEMFVTLSAGGKVILAANALYLPTLPARDEVTLMNVVPSVMAELVRVGGIPTSVQTINLAGEALPEALVQQLYATTSARRVYNLYGPTETSYATFTLVEPGKPVWIGKPLSNTQCYILDTQLQPVPIGVTGELYIAGAGLARGYYGRPDLTHERFLRNPFGEDDSRMYRTGDRCRWLSDGNIQYLGRTDYQVKLRGFRIELGEVEAALDRHPAVRQSVVMIREDEPGSRNLVAYVVLKSSRTSSVEELKVHVRESLPDFMTPAFIVIIDALPQTPNGKINRLALPVPQYSRQAGLELIAPRTHAEEVVAGIWREVLKLDSVGVYDNFFELGGHSLLATQVISRIRQLAGCELPLRYLFEYPTVFELALRVDDSAAQVRKAIHLAPRNHSIQLSFAQQRMWFIDQLEPNQPIYNVPCTLKVNSALDLVTMQRTIDALVARHETLRTNFAAEGGNPVQVVSASIHVAVRWIDLSELTSELREAEAFRSIGIEAQRPFDLATDSLLRVGVYRLTAECHILFLNIHHIISDRWSVTVLISEIAALYESLSEGKIPSLPDLPIQYADFSVWQRGSEQAKVIDGQLSYWMAELKDAPPMIELPTDRPRPSIASSKGGCASLTIPTELTTQLNHLSRRSGATLYMTLLAAFEILLSRYSGQEDMVVGMPIASRNHPEIEGLIGLFANTLPLRAKLGGDPTFVEVIARTKDAALGAYAHQDVPFERLVEELRPERSLSYDPLVQVYFILQNAPHEGVTLNGKALQHIPTDSKTSKGDLYLSLAEREGRLFGRLEYNAEIFDRATMERLLGHYQNLLESAVSNCNLRMSQLEILNPLERKQLLEDWNATETDYPRNLCVHQLFEAQVRRTPDAVACGFEAQTLTYAQLNARANQAAHFLQHLGVAAGQRIGIFMERSLDMMVGLLAIQKSGAAYVPLDPSYPTERLRYTLEDSQPPVILTQQALLNMLPKHEAQVLCIDSDWPIFAKQSTTNPESSVQPTDLIYVIFTSGTTGRPKGVQVPHRAVVNLLNFMATELHMGDGDVFPALASFAFDMCIPELYLAITSGGRTIIGRRSLASNGEELAAMLRQIGATVVHATPTTWNLLLEAGFSGKGLKRAIGAEPLPRDLCRRLLEADSSLYNFYGPTETTVWSTFHHFHSPDEAVVLGRPLANTQIYILDRSHRPVPIGVVGEIYIAGDGVTHGYLNRPDLTREKFVPNPFSLGTNPRMYSTGDVGRYLPDGRIEFQGRVDSQVKVRGYRIELGDVETAIGSYPSLQECVVIAREDVPGDKRLVAYVVAARGTKIDTLTLRGWVKERLPDYMVPAAWVEMERLPLSPNGKVDRKRLPVPEYSRPEITSAFQQAQSPTEEVIAAIWSEVLKLDLVGRFDDFFELGGHSLLATQVVSRIRQAFQIELPLRTLFEDPNVAGLAKHITALQKQKLGSSIPLLKRVPRDQPLPLSFAQQRLWFLDQLEPNNPLYNVSYITRMSGQLQPHFLKESVQQIVRRHESLRTTFSIINDEPIQVINPDITVPFDIVDLTTLPLEGRDEEARRQVIEEVKRPFNLATGPLLRAKLIKLSELDHALVLNTHHIISDRWSLGVLSQELATLYEAMTTGQPSPLPDLPIQYADYAVWQRSYLSGQVLEEQLNYWKQQLEGAPPTLELPTDRPRGSLKDYWGLTHKLAIPEDLTLGIRSLSRKNSVTLFMTLLAGFQLLLARYAETDDIVIGTDLANRTQLETESLIGFFVNLLPIRGRFAGDPTFEQILSRVREASLGAYAHQDIPFDKLVEELQPERSLTHNPLVQVLFVMQNTPPMVQQIGALKLGPLGVSSSSRFDLVLFVNDPDHSPFTTWMYNPNLFDASSIQRMSSLYEVLLRCVVEDASIKLSSLHEVLAKAEDQEREAAQRGFQEKGLQKLKQVRRRPAIQI